jgi:hypothetical protein
VLVPEPGNRHDGNEVRIEIDGGRQPDQDALFDTVEPGRSLAII